MFYVLLAALVLGGVSHAAESHFTLDDVYRIVGFSSPRIAPDGKTLIFVRSTVDLEHDRRDGKLVALDLATRDQRVLGADRTVDSPAWSPDGKHIAFLADDAHHDSQIYLTTPQGGVPVQLTHAATGVDQFAWRPDGAAIAYVSEDEAPKKTGVARWQDAYRVTDNAYLQTGPFPPSHLWLVSLDGNERRLSSGTWSVAGGDAASTLSWTPNGASLYYVRLPDALLGDALDSVVQRLDASTGHIAGLTGRTRYEFNPLVSPDGAHVAYTYARGGDPMNEADIYVSPGTGAGRDLTRRTLDANATNYAWYPDSSAVLVGAPAGTRNALWRVQLDGRVQRLSLGDVDAIGDFDGSIAKDGGIAFVGTGPHDPGEVYYRTASGTIERLTHDNEWIGSKTLGRVEALNWKGPNGFSEDGVIYYPAGYRANEPKKRYPLVLLIHGGPTSASTTSFDELAQVMSARGWFVLRPNYRGSDNLGNAYQHAIYIDATRGPGNDIIAGVDAAQRSLPIDSRKICVSGWSYGGMMTSWLITQDHRWACAVSGAAVNDLVYDYSLADDIGDDRVSMPGSPFVGKNMAAYRAVSPLTFYRNVRTPTLILSDTYDNRVPAAQSYAFYHALHDQGTTVEFYQWPVHGHWPGDPVRTVDVYRYWTNWIEKYVK